MNSPVEPAADHQPEFGPLTDHAYDGIREYDNPLPGWWKWLFIVSIAFSFVYFPFYHFGAPGRSVADQYDVALGENTRLQFSEIGELAGDESTILRFMQKKEWVRVGQTVFKSNCSTCHRADGGGLVGPNLGDEHFKNIRTVEDIYRVITNGAAGGAMPAWKTRLQNNELVLTAAYVASMRGTNPAGGKEAEGNLIPAWPAPPPEPEPTAAPDDGKKPAEATDKKG
jgi:cytochrome c oxidase cbb3-type subunit III